jgi:hypothetical protein
LDVFVCSFSQPSKRNVDFDMDQTGSRWEMKVAWIDGTYLSNACQQFTKPKQKTPGPHWNPLDPLKSQLQKIIS